MFYVADHDVSLILQRLTYIRFHITYTHNCSTNSHTWIVRKNHGTRIQTEEM